MFEKDGHVELRRLHTPRGMRPYVTQQSHLFDDWLLLERVSPEEQGTMECMMVLQFFFRDQKDVWRAHFARGLAYLYRRRSETDADRLLALATRAWAGMPPEHVDHKDGRLILTLKDPEHLWGQRHSRPTTLVPVPPSASFTPLNT